MSRSSIQGARRTRQEPAGRDTASLGPGDSSDSGSDMMGISDSTGGDPTLPTDVALRDDQAPLAPSADALTTADDAAGTGERRSAGADGGKPDGWDIGVDQVVTPEGTEDAEDADLAFINEAEAGDALLEDEGEDAEEEDDDGAPGSRP